MSRARYLGTDDQGREFWISETFFENMKIDPVDDARARKRAEELRALIDRRVAQR